MGYESYDFIQDECRRGAGDKGLDERDEVDAVERNGYIVLRAVEERFWMAPGGAEGVAHTILDVGSESS